MHCDLFFWAENSEGLIATKEKFNSSFNDYFQKRFGIATVLKRAHRHYYERIPNEIGRPGQPLNEDLLGYFIAKLTLKDGAFESMTELPIVRRDDIP